MPAVNKDKESIFDAIYDVVRCVPRGRVTSYGAVAAAIGVTSGARVVGYAMNASFSAKPKVPHLPCLVTATDSNWPSCKKPSV